MSPRQLLLEIVPPLRSSGRKGLTDAVEYIRRVAETLPLDAVNIPEIHTERQRCGTGRKLTPCEERVPTRDFASHIKHACGVDCILNHVVVQDPAEKLVDWLHTCARDYGIHRFVFVGGESSALTYPGPTVGEANAIVRELFQPGDVRVGNICIPSRCGEAQRVQGKIDRGADFFSTQIIYHPAELLTFTDALLGAGINTAGVDFYISFCPVKSARGIRFLNQLGVTLPPSVQAWRTQDQSLLLERSKSHLVGAWGELLQHLRQSPAPLSLGINLSPIGKIGIDDTIDLGRRLMEVL